MILNTKDLVFKKRPVKKLMERYVRSYEIKVVVSRNTVKLKLLASMRIHPVVSISKIERHREPVRGQKVEEPKLVEIDRVEKWKVL